VFLEKGIPGYESESLIHGEVRISRESLVALLIASGFIGALVYAVDIGFDLDKIKESLTRSVYTIDCVSPREAQLALQLVERFMSYPIIRENHPLEDWLCEAIWPAFQTSPYIYPSAMSSAVAYGTRIRVSLEKCTIQY
jgi:hypothetical protein